jgi:hypothetical protein
MKENISNYENMDDDYGQFYNLDDYDCENPRQKITKRESRQEMYNDVNKNSGNNKSDKGNNDFDDDHYVNDDHDDDYRKREKLTLFEKTMYTLTVMLIFVVIIKFV